MHATHTPIFKLFGGKGFRPAEATLHRWGEIDSVTPNHP